MGEREAPNLTPSTGGAPVQDSATMHHGDCEHVRSKRGDSSPQVFGLSQRLLSLGAKRLHKHNSEITKSFAWQESRIKTSETLQSDLGNVCLHSVYFYMGQYIVVSSV